MTDQYTQSILIRLASVEEHVQAATRMVHTGVTCPDLLRQLAAMRSAVGEIAKLVVQDHSENCLVKSSHAEHREAEIASLLAALELFI